MEIFDVRIKSWLSERNPQPDEVHEPSERHDPARQGVLVDGENRHLQVCLKQAGNCRTACHSKSTSTDECRRSLHPDPGRNAIADVPPVHSSRRPKPAKSSKKSSEFITRLSVHMLSSGTDSTHPHRSRPARRIVRELRS